MLYFTNIKTTLGTVQIVADERNVTAVHFLYADFDTEHSSRLIVRAKNQLIEYLLGSRQEFSLPLLPEGSSFEKSVFDAVRKIPFGKTATCHEIAAAVGNPKCFYTINSVLMKNPIPIFIPCHRVIFEDNSLGTYIGGSALKTHLLILEGNKIADGKITK